MMPPPPGSTATASPLRARTAGAPGPPPSIRSRPVSRRLRRLRAQARPCAPETAGGSPQPRGPNSTGISSARAAGLRLPRSNSSRSDAAYSTRWRSSSGTRTSIEGATLALSPRRRRWSGSQRCISAQSIRWVRRGPAEQLVASLAPRPHPHLVTRQLRGRVLGKASSVRIGPVASSGPRSPPSGTL